MDVVELERRWSASKCVADETALVRARLSAGVIGRERVREAAAWGSTAARQSLYDDEALPEKAFKPRALCELLGTEGRPMLVRVLIPLVRKVWRDFLALPAFTVAGQDCAEDLDLLLAESSEDTQRIDNRAELANDVEDWLQRAETWLNDPGEITYKAVVGAPALSSELWLQSLSAERTQAALMFGRTPLDAILDDAFAIEAALKGVYEYGLLRWSEAEQVFTRTLIPCLLGHT